MFEWLPKLIPAAIKYTHATVSTIREKGNHKNEAFANFHYGNNPCRNFIHKKIHITSESINQHIKLQVNQKISDDREKITKIEQTFRPFNIPYIPTTYKKQKHTDPYSDFFSDMTYREEFTTILKYADTKIDLKQKNIKDIYSEQEIIELITRLISDASQLQNPNTAMMLLGNIGSGKTAFFSKIIFDIARSNTKDSQLYKLAISINFEAILNSDNRHSIAINEVIEELIKNINSTIKQSITKTKTKYNKHQSYKLILFLDNLDIVYQKFCEDYFISPEGHKFVDIFLGLVEKMLNRDFHEHSLFLVCALRGESVNALNDIEYGSPEKLNDFFSIRFEILNKNAQEIKSIITKRLKFASDLCQKENFSEEIKTIVYNNYITFQKTTNINFEEIHNISSEGLRNTIDLFYRVTPSLFVNNVFDRFFIDGYYIKKLHFLGDSTEYTQAKNGIFNIFLNNAQYRQAEKGHLNNMSGLSKVSNDRLIELSTIPHIHTYWLKYFILSYLYTIKFSQNVNSPSVNDLISFFSPKNTPYRYEENLVRLVLLGLSESRHGKILDIVLSHTGNDINTFELSDRGKYILENIIWTFDYLSIVVEDYWLQFPDEIQLEFNWLFEPETSYCYLTNKDDFENMRKKSLEIKIKKVKLFLEILEISYEVEKEKIGGLFKDLEKKVTRISNAHFQLPSFPNIKNKIFQTIKNYSQECNVKLVGSLSLYTSIMNHKQKKFYKEFFQINYGIKNQFQKDRENYHLKNQETVDKLVSKHQTSQPILHT